MPTFSIDPSDRKPRKLASVLNYVGGLFADLKVALRSLGRTPSLWATVALTLALGLA